MKQSISKHIVFYNIYFISYWQKRGGVLEWESLKSKLETDEVKKVSQFAFVDFKGRAKFPVNLTKVLDCQRQKHDFGMNYKVSLQLSSGEQKNASSWEKAFLVKIDKRKLRYFLYFIGFQLTL
ncbi:hypothetical protein KKE68_08180 [Patescibacteria group bacterium]|nr:hypothetical protein [Patescibacteria group bacterium]